MPLSVKRRFAVRARVLQAVYNRGMKSALHAALAALVLAGCGSSPATPSSAAAGVQDGDPATVNRDCKLLGTVSARSLFGLADEIRVQNAMNSAREKAAAMGATHVVFLTSDTQGILNTGQATARAYRCDKPS